MSDEIDKVAAEIVKIVDDTSLLCGGPRFAFVEFQNAISEILNKRLDAIAADYNKTISSLKQSADKMTEQLDRVTRERDRFKELPDWLISKIKTMGEYYNPPADSRDQVTEIYGWMHILCHSYLCWKKWLPIHDKEKKESREQLATLTRERDEANVLLGEVARRKIDSVEGEPINTTAAVWERCADYWHDKAKELERNQTPKDSTK